jgi:DNA ligase-1
VEGSESCYSARKEKCRENYDTGGYLPDVWFAVKEVWEIRGADITLSPVYQAAKGYVSEERGLSLRFPRFLGRRLDKNPEDATGPQQLADLYKNQYSDGKTEPLDGADAVGEGSGEEE